MLIEALVRRFPALRSLSEATTGARLTGHLSLATGQTEAEFTEMTRAGRRFAGVFGTAGQAILSAVPTTTSQWTLYNADLNRSYVIDSITAWFLSGTAGIGGTLFTIVSPITATLPAAAATATVANQSLGGLVSKAVLQAAAYTIPAVTGQTQWAVTPGQQGQAAGIIPGLGGNFTADVRGRIIVPPGKILGINLVTAAGTSPLYIVGCTWHEVELDLE